MSTYIPLGEPRKDWITYFDDGSYEPVDPDGNLNKKPMDRREPEWMVVGKKPDWRPEKYSGTKRGQKAKRELGTKNQSQQTNQSQSLFAPQKTEPKGSGTNAGTNTGTGTKSLPGFGGTAWPKATTMPDLSGNSGFSGQTDNKAPKRPGPNSLMTASMEEITGLLAGIDKQKTASSQPNAKQPNFARTTQAAKPTANRPAPKQTTLPAPNAPKEKNDQQPQYRLTGHAVAGEGAHNLHKAERKQHNARKDVDHRSQQEMIKERERELAPGKKALSIAKGHIGSGKYRRSVPLDSLPAESAKCNKFVYDMQMKAGNQVPLIGGPFGGNPPSASDWANPRTDIEGWAVEKNPRNGDVAAYEGHVGIVSGKNKTISAASPTKGDSVVENDWGFRSDQHGRTVFKRYVGTK